MPGVEGTDGAFIISAKQDSTQAENIVFSAKALYTPSGIDEVTVEFDNGCIVQFSEDDATEDEHYVTTYSKSVVATMPTKVVNVKYHYINSRTGVEHTYNAHFNTELTVATVTATYDNEYDANADKTLTTKITLTGILPKTATQLLGYDLDEDDDVNERVINVKVSDTVYKAEPVSKSHHTYGVAYLLAEYTDGTSQEITVTSVQEVDVTVN